MKIVEEHKGEVLDYFKTKCERTEESITNVKSILTDLESKLIIRKRRLSLVEDAIIINKMVNTPIESDNDKVVIDSGRNLNISGENS